MRREIRAALLGLIAAAGTAGADDFEAVNEAEFRKLIPAGARVEKLAGDMKFVEGPVWVPALGALLFSDIPADALKRWSPAEGLSTYRAPSRQANGNALDGQGRLVTCEHAARRVSITEPDGSVVTLVDRYDGQRLNSPNDLAVKSDGTIWFTDPPYGLKDPAQRELPKNYVFRFDPSSKALAPAADDFDRPNGICFSPDEAKLYVADSGKPRHIRVFDVRKDGTLADGKVFCAIDKGGPDGIRCDREGRVWSSAGDGVQIFAPDGSRIGRVLLPEAAANLCFGGADGRTLFMTARASLYSVKLAPAEKP